MQRTWWQRPQSFYGLVEVSSSVLSVKQRSQSGAAASYFGGSGFKSVPKNGFRDGFFVVFRGFPKSLKANARIVRQIRLRTLPSWPSKISNPLTIPPFDAVYICCWRHREISHGITVNTPKSYTLCNSSLPENYQKLVYMYSSTKRY